MKNVQILSEGLETKATNWDDYACPKAQNLIFKDEEHNGVVSTTHFVMLKLFTVQKSAFAYGTWTPCFLNKL